MNPMLMAVFLGERNKGMNRRNFPATAHNVRVLRFGNKGLLMAQNCRTEKTSKDSTPAISQNSLSSRILQAYFRKRAHSCVVRDRLKDFQIERLRKEKTRVIGTLTVHPSSFQTSPGKDLNNGSSLSWVSHNTSNTGFSKFLQQHASATAVALDFDSMSLPAMSLTISSTLRQACINLEGAFDCVSMAYGTQKLTVSVDVVGVDFKSSWSPSALFTPSLNVERVEVQTTRRRSAIAVFL